MPCRFVANPVPASTTQPRYEGILEDQAHKRHAAHATRALTLKVGPAGLLLGSAAA